MVQTDILHKIDQLAAEIGVDIPLNQTETDAAIQAFNRASLLAIEEQKPRRKSDQIDTDMHYFIHSGTKENTESYIWIYEPEVYPEWNIRELLQKRTNIKYRNEIEYSGFQVWDLIEILLEIKHEEVLKTVSLLVHITMLNPAGLYGIVYGRPLYKDNEDVIYRKTQGQAKIPFPLYGKGSKIANGRRNLSTTFCRWIRTHSIMEYDIVGFKIYKQTLAEKFSTKISKIL